MNRHRRSRAPDGGTGTRHLPQAIALPLPAPTSLFATGRRQELARCHSGQLCLRLEGLEVHHALEAPERELPQQHRVDGDAAAGASAQGGSGAVPAAAANARGSRTAGIVPQAAAQAATLLTMPATAQSQQPAPSAPAATAPAPAAASGQWRASKLIGLNVYNEQNEKLGEINEVLLDKSGKAAGVLIGVGGFLGMGEHDAMVGFDKLKWVNELGAHDDCPARRNQWHGDKPAASSGTQRQRDVVFRSRCPERDQGSAQGHATVQVQLSGLVDCKLEPRLLPLAGCLF